MTFNPPRKRLLRPAAPVPGESLRGLVADACARNHIPNTWGMLQHFGLPHRNRVDISESEDLDTSALASALAVSEADVSTRRYPSTGRRHRSFYGLQLNAGRIENRVRRFSPAALAAGQTHHPAVHELRDLPFSPVGWDLIQEKCPCEAGGVRQGWTRVNGTDRCDRCGGRLDRLDPIIVPERLRPPLSLLAGLVDPDESARQAALNILPASIRSSNRSLLFDTTILLGECLSDDGLGTGSTAMQPTEGLALACEALLGWPNGLVLMRPGSRVPEWKWERARRNYLVLDRCPDPERNGGVAPSQENPPKRHAVYVPSGRCGRIEQPFISAMAAARLAGVDECALKQAWDDGLITQHSWAQGPNRVRAFDPDEVADIAPRLRTTKPRARVALMLGISVFGVEQLAAIGIFSPNAPEAGRSQTEVHQDEALRLISELHEGAAERVDEPIPLIEAVRHISGRPKPWGAVFQHLLEAQLPYTCAIEKEAPLVKRIAVGSGSLRRITSLNFDRQAHPSADFGRRWSQRDALECLNGDVNAPELLEKLTSSGTRPKWYLASEVEALAEQGVTTADLARRANMSVSKAYLVLEHARTRQIAPGLWDREAAERTVLS